jgi:hypothetical protein
LTVLSLSPELEVAPVDDSHAFDCRPSDASGDPAPPGNLDEPDNARSDSDGADEPDDTPPAKL